MRWPTRWERPRGERWGNRPGVPLPEALKKHRDPAALLRAMERVSEAREAAWGNVNPQLLLAVLGGELAEVL